MSCSSYLYSYKSNRTEIISCSSAAQHMSENNAICAFDLVGICSTSRGQNYPSWQRLFHSSRLCSRLLSPTFQARQGASQTSLLSNMFDIYDLSSATLCLDREQINNRNDTNTIEHFWTNKSLAKSREPANIPWLFWGYKLALKSSSGPNVHWIVENLLNHIFKWLLALLFVRLDYYQFSYQKSEWLF